MPLSVISVVVADAGPLIALGRLDQLGLLSKMFAQVQVPNAVLAECVAKPELADARRIQVAVGNGWLIPCEEPDFDAPGLQPSERAAIGRAIRIGAGLLADDMAARLQAANCGLAVVGTLGVLVRAKRLGLLPAVAPAIEQLRDSGHYLGARSIAAAMALAGE